MSSSWKPASSFQGWGVLGGCLTHQDEFVVGQLAGPIGFGAVPLQKSLCAVDLVLILPSG